MAIVANPSAPSAPSAPSPTASSPSMSMGDAVVSLEGVGVAAGGGAAVRRAASFSESASATFAPMLPEAKSSAALLRECKVSRDTRRSAAMCAGDPALAKLLKRFDATGWELNADMNANAAPPSFELQMAWSAAGASESLAKTDAALAALSIHTGLAVSCAHDGRGKLLGRWRFSWSKVKSV